MNPDIANALTIFLSAVISTIWAAKVWRICQKRQIINHINSRSSHTVPTPSGGGLTFVIPTTLYMILWLFLQETRDPFLIALLCGSSILAYIGWQDDKKPLPAFLRLGIQCLVVSIMVFFLTAYFRRICRIMGQ